MADKEKWYCAVKSHSWTHESFDVIFSDRVSRHADNREELDKICEEYEKLGYKNRDKEYKRKMSEV